MLNSKKNYYVDKTAAVSSSAKIGSGTKIWHHSQVRENAIIGNNCVIGKGVYIDTGVKIGNRVKIQNYVSVFRYCEIEDGVFLGPYVCFTNDKYPRAIQPNGNLKTDEDWKIGRTMVKKGASIGAATIILPDIAIGDYAMVGADSLVTEDIPEYALVYGVPARIHGYVCRCGTVVSNKKTPPSNYRCKTCRENKIW